MAVFAVLLGPIPDAASQGGNIVTETIVGRDSGRTWKFRNDGVELGRNDGGGDGVTGWGEVGYDDSAWLDTDMAHFTDRNNDMGDFGFYYREEFEINDLFNITPQGLTLDIFYDDATILYLNGVEVYRSIRNNLPDESQIPVSSVMPITTQIPYGGLEINEGPDPYVQIPAASNNCQQGCGNDTSTVAVDIGLLNEGTNVFSSIVWTTPDSDIWFDFAMDIERDLDTPLPELVLINEIVASNDTLLDEDNDTPDWFELYNPGDDPVSLNNWIIQDSSANWQFPKVTIGAGDHLVVFASDKDRDPTNGDPLHTNFKLSKDGDTLKLINDDSFVMDEYAALPRQITDVSFGRVNDGETITYLASTTPAATNTGSSSALDPVLRTFSDRLFNLNDSVVLQIDAFDPDGGALTYSMPNNLGLQVDAATGLITGTASSVGEFVYTITVTDPNSQTASDNDVRFTVVEEATALTPLVLNEYNAVAPDRELSGGFDPAFGQVLGNGGDWYEFIVVQDLLDIRGWTLQFWDRDNGDDSLDRAATLTFSDDFFLADLPAGMIITISEDRPDDLRFNPANGDWHVNLQSNDDTPGALFAVQENFNSTRSDQHVEIRDADGVLRSPIVGETDPWDDANGGVGGFEVMNLCIDPLIDGFAVDPIADYRDNSTKSTYGFPNECTFPDPNDPMGIAVIEFDQDLAPLRASGNVRGDVNCDGVLGIVDALLISQLVTMTRTDIGTCPLVDVANDINGDVADFNVSDGVNIVDALLISRCVVGVVADVCGNS